MSGIMNKLGLGHKDNSSDHHDSTSASDHHSSHGATTTTTTTTTNNSGLNNSGLTGSGLNNSGWNNQSTTATGINQPYGSSTASSTTRSGAAYSNTGIASNTGMASNQYNQTGRLSGDDAMTRSEEQLRVAKTTVETGKAELNKTVETVHVEQAVPVAKERVVIEREPITQANLPAAMSGPAISEAHYETTLKEDRVAATKETVPIERIRLAKQTETSVESVGADLRKEHVDLTMHSMDNAKTDINRGNLHGDKIDTIGRSGIAHDNSKFDTGARSGLAHDSSLHSSNIGTTTAGRSGLHDSNVTNSSLHSSSNTRNI